MKSIRLCPPRLIRLGSIIVLGVIAFTLVAAAAPPGSDSSKLPDDALRLQQTYRQDLDRAVQPVKERYISDLKRILESTTRAGKLDAALAIKAEIDAVSGDSGLSPEEFAHRLEKTNWSWNNSFPIAFGSGGAGTSKWGDFTWTTVKPYTVEYTFRNGNHGTIVFEGNLRKATIDETAGDGTKNRKPMTLIRLKD